MPEKMLRYMKKFDPEWRPVAFKEWKLVVQALVRGEQTVILRKGGISEGKAGFQWLHDRFFLFPSLFHEQAKKVKPNEDGSPRTLDGDGRISGRIAFGVYVEILASGRLTNWEEVQRLQCFHIWTEETVRERFEWGDQLSISYAVVQPHLLKEPWLLEDRDTFGGCRSWFGLPTDEGGDWRQMICEAIPSAPICGRPDWLL